MALPKQRSKAVSAAYIRALGATQKEAASALGVSDRTIRAWESDGEWEGIKREAHDKFLKELAAKTRRALLESLDDPQSRAATARFLAPRVLPEFSSGSESEPQRKPDWYDFGDGDIVVFD